MLLLLLLLLLLQNRDFCESERVRVYLLKHLSTHVQRSYVSVLLKIVTLYGRALSCNGTPFVCGWPSCKNWIEQWIPWQELLNAMNCVIWSWSAFGWIPIGNYDYWKSWISPIFCVMRIEYSGEIDKMRRLFMVSFNNWHVFFCLFSSCFLFLFSDDGVY